VGPPLNLNLKSASSAKAADAALWPRDGQGRQKVNRFALRLQQHLRETGGSRRVAVDREDIL
jgi:hypothetical protein